MPHTATLKSSAGVAAPPAELERGVVWLTALVLGMGLVMV